MWEPLPISELGAWDGQCIWKENGVDRRCNKTSGPDRIGNREELLARTRRGERLTQQEMIDLAKGLCCSGWHSTEYIAQQICNIWARQPASEASLLALEIEVERLKQGYAELSRELEKSKAMEKHLCESSFTTTPKIINSVIDDQAAAKVELKVDVKEDPTLQTTLLSDATLPSLLTTPSSSAQKLTISAISTLYEVADISAHPPQLPIQLNVTTNEHEHSGLLAQAVPVATYIETLLVYIFHAWSFLCFFSSLAFAKFTSVVFWRGVVAWMQAINGEIAQVMRKYYSNQVEEGQDTLLEEQEAPEAPYPLLQPVVSDPEDREQEKEGSAVVYPVAQPVLSDPEDQEQEKEALEVVYHVPQSLMFDPEGQEQKEAPEVLDHVPQWLVLDLEDQEQEKEAPEAAIAVLESVVLGPEDREPDMEVIDTTNIDAPHHPNELGKLPCLPAIETEHIKPTFPAIAGRKLAKPRKRTLASR